jgi:uncharacterized protein involved in exopolysaccharide biosynthesis
MTERPSLPQGDKIRKIPPQEITQNDMPIPPQGWQPYSVEDDTIDLMELLTTLWRYKWLLILLPIFGIIGSYTAVQFLPVEYQSRVTFLQISGNGGSTDLGKFGALASLAGVSLPEKSSDMLTDKIEVVLKSRGFAEQIVKEKELLPIIFSDIYDPETKTFDIVDPELGPPKPLDGAGAIMEALELGETDEGAKFIEVSWDDPVIAADLANYTLKALEIYLSQNTLTAGQKNLQFIEKQLGKAEKELRQGEEALRNFNTDKKYFIKFTESEVLAKALVEMQAMHAKAEVDKEVMLQFRNKRSPQVQQLSLGNEALERQIKNYSNVLQDRSNQIGSLKVEKEFLTKELEVYQEIYKQLRIQLEQQRLEASKDETLFRIIDPALEPEHPSKPKKRLIVALSAVVSLFFGIFLVFLIEFARNFRERVE